MENHKLISKIRSIYILKNIFNYIKDNNLQYKLIFYSKSLQKKLNILLIDYKEKYIEKIGGFDIYKYYIKKNDRDYLKEEYNKFLFENKLNKEEFERDLYEVLEKKETKNEDIIKQSEKLINIDSPLFEIISKIKYFENNYTIYISQYNIDKYQLKKYYKKIFDKLNKLNIKYSSIFYNFIDTKAIKYLKEFNIDFNKIKIIILNSDIKIKIKKKEK